MSRSTLHSIWLAALPWLLYPMLLFAGTSTTSSKSAPAANSQTAGERLFAQNCARCHQPPTSLSPTTTGTILMHMRTRARLSREDEQALLKFMAP